MSQIENREGAFRGYVFRPETASSWFTPVRSLAIFSGGFTFLGLVFAAQEWVGQTALNHKVGVSFAHLAFLWAVNYLLWGLVCWIMWLSLRSRIGDAGLVSVLCGFLPLSIVVSLVQEMVWVALFPEAPSPKWPMSYGHRLRYFLDIEAVDNLAVVWFIFLLIRGIVHYQRFRRAEESAAELRSELANAQLRALRMQLNPHFLFNTLNSVCSLMGTDVPAADKMVVQLSTLLRTTLERFDTQMISLKDEMEFLGMYLAIQDQRFTGKVRHETHIEPATLDAMIPVMLLQPILENAYAHGLSRVERDGVLFIGARTEGSHLKISVRNSGIGLGVDSDPEAAREGVGLANVRDRLRLHYEDDQSLCIQEIENGAVEVTVRLPLVFADTPTETLKGYGE